ncbi:hypothetical protein CLV30_12817 [Haloactinopolyspora alba]|uniref:Phage tail tape measure protein domain-containing protein n=1 Tax=Haloactinopolyspora alba TaxID=648780 RepID=A0A2P8DEW9_9ACTN|nr:phage tail tape measure protein [Haloactinopolyspora alba]PSK95765.1 hypothetical protein CLV30_12817 [Haloactinopolyspora alba]
MALNIGELVGYVDLDDSGFEQGMAGAEGKFDAFGSRLGAAATAVGVAVGGALGAGLLGALDLQDANALVSAQLRLTQEESARIGNVAGDLYADAYGDSMEQVNEALRAVTAQMGGLGNVTDEELTKAGQKALDLSKILGTDVTRVTQIAGQAVRNGMAKDFDEAFDLIAAASSKTMPGLEDDLLDAIDEYGPFFDAVGITGPRAFGLLAQASQQGMYGIDKTGDAVKEFTIRATDMSTASVEAYDLIGLNAEKMADRILAGGDQAQGAFDKIIRGLLSIESPSERANAAIALFGTPVEDLAVNDIPDFLRSLVDTKSGLTDVAGAATDMGNTLNDTARVEITAFGRTVKTEVVEFLETRALPVITNLAGAARDQLGPAWEAVSGWLSQHRDAADEYLEPIGEAVAHLWEELGVLWDSLTNGEGTLTMVGELLMTAGGGMLFLGQQIGPAVELVADLVGWFAELPGPVQTAVLAFAGLTVLRPQLAGLGDTVRTGVTGALHGARDAADGARLRFMYLGDAARGAATGGIASLTGAIGRGAGQGLRAAAGGLLTVMGGPLGLAIAGVSIALGFLAQRHMEAKQAAAEQEAQADALGGTLDERTGAITRQTEELVAQQAAEEGVLDAATELGIAHEDVTQAALGNADALARVNEALDRSREAAVDEVWREHAAGLELMGAAEEDVTAAIHGDADARERLQNLGSISFHKDMAEATQRTSAEQEILSGFVDETAAALAREAEALVQADGAMSDTDPDPLAESMGVLADETADADTKARALDEALRILAGGSLSLEEAQGRANEAIRRVQEALAAATEEAGGNTSALFTNTGAIDTTTDAGWRLFQSVNSARESMAAEAQAARDLAIANGKDAKGGLDAARAASERVRSEFVRTAEQAGLSRRAARRLANQYGLIPDDVVTTLKATDRASGVADDAEERLRDYDGRNWIAELSALAYTSAAEDDLSYLARDRTVDLFIESHRYPGVPYLNQADGGVVTPAASGLMREPMIAAGGSNILWAEPETHGEAYIPLAASKRARSLDILREVADRFGYGLAQQDSGASAAMAGGGTTRLHGDDLAALASLMPSMDGATLRLQLGSEVVLATVVDAGKRRQESLGVVG